MSIDDFEARLAALDGHFRNASADGASFELPDPGNYQAIFRRVDFFERKDAPNDAFLKLTYEIVFDPNHEGREVDFIYSLEPQKTGASAEEVEMKLGFLKRDLRTLGVDVTEEDFSLTRIAPGASLWDDLLDCTVELAIRDSKKVNPNTGRAYRNAFLNERTGDALPPATDVPAVVDPLPVAAVDTDPGIPF